MRPRPRSIVIGIVLLLLAVVFGAIAVPATIQGSASSDRTTQAGQEVDLGATVLIGTGGLTWSDVSQETTPNLWDLLRDGSSAAMSIRSVMSNTCPIDGWLGLSAGARAAATRPGPASNPVQDPCPALPEVAAPTGPVEGWSDWVATASGNNFDADLGLLGQETQDADVCVQAIGSGAGIGAARTDGSVAAWAPYAAADLVTLTAGCRLVLVDVGAVRDPDDVATGEPTQGSRADQIAAVDQRIGEVRAAAPLGADLIVASLSDAGTSERLRLVVAQGPRFGAGRLDSASTRQPGLVQAQDLTVTLLTLSGLTPPSSLGGTTLVSVPAPDNSEGAAQSRLRSLIDQDEASHEVHSLVPPFFNAFAYGQLVIYLLVFLVWTGRVGSPQTRLGALSAVRVVAVAAASVPASTFLANLLPWWRVDPPMLGVVGAVGLFVALIAAVALSGPWRQSPAGPVAVVAAITMAVLAIDVMTGSRLQISSLMGLQPVVAGRFYGMGNVTFAIFVTSAILLATMVSSWLVRRDHQQLAALLVAVIGLATVVIDGSPAWGADGGGPPATIPAFVYLVLSILGVRLTWTRALAIGAASVVVFLGVAFLDWLRPPESRTHLGRFIQAILDGDALDIIIRKGQQNLDILLGNAPLTLLVPAALLFVIYVLARPTSWGAKALQRSYDRLPTLRAGLIALVVALTIGFLINDSGTAIPAVGATVAVPLMVAVAARTLRDEVKADAPSRRARRS